MHQRSAVDEALQCRHLAAGLPGGPERDILMHLAFEFHCLAEKGRAKAKLNLSKKDEECEYLARRARQHTHAAVLSSDQAVKSVHYELAVRYFELIDVKCASAADPIYA